jgi:hypothetical protein
VDLDAVEARLRGVLDPYRGRLTPGSVYGLQTIGRPGSKAHAFFAGVRRADRRVALHLMPIYRHPELLDGCSPALRARLKGRTTFNFTTLDEPLLADLEALVGRSFEEYISGA